MELTGVYIIVGVAVLILFVWVYQRGKKNATEAKLQVPFPKQWKKHLHTYVLYYNELDAEDRKLFEKRIQLFLADKNIEGIDTDIDDSIRLMVASSAIIPTFAFPEYNYPNVRTVLIYPNSFDEQFQTTRFKGHKEFISGMVGNRFMNGTVILSKPDLIKGFDGAQHKGNVGIHEFVHLLDKEDGAIDGVPELLLKHRYVGSWLHEIKNEMHRIRKGESDINPYALTNNAEFLAVVSEYFFSNADSFHTKHPKLYALLASIYQTQTERKSN